MDFDDYQEQANQTAVYPSSASIVYPAGKLAGEAGELCNKVFKGFRDPHAPNALVGTEHLMSEFRKHCEKNREDLISELGDILWYVNAICSDMGIRLAVVAHQNIEKLRSRQERGRLKGAGDGR